MPFERRGVVPAERVDIESRSGIALERLGRAKRNDRRRQVVVPGTGEGIVLLVRECVIGPQPYLLGCPKNRDPVDAAALFGDMFFVPPAQAAEEIKLPFLGMVVVVRIRAGQRVIPGFVHMRVSQKGKNKYSVLKQ